MENANGVGRKLKSPTMDASPSSSKTSVTCVNVPEALFDAAAAKKHFSKFGRVQKITLLPKRYMCIVEYDQPVAAERAVLNAGAYDGFMFDVSRTKTRVRKRSKKEDDPDWVPDSDVEEELVAMGATPTYRVTRQKQMDVDPAAEVVKKKSGKRIPKQSPIRKTVVVKDKKASSQPPSGTETPVVVAPQTSMSTVEAAAELNQLRSRVSLTPDEQWRTLDIRDKILRSWGGAGSRVKVGGATIGTCPDMCPEKELLHRKAEHQVMTLETVPDSDGILEPWRAVKQYSRSSADQEIPMCYELRPPPVLMRTCAYLLHEIADTKRQVTLADWFHFMWDRLRGIRKDITQQALCCAESIYLVEMCARFHAHCAARLADLEHTQFDQKLNTDNLTKCLQTLKHMYADVGPDKKPNEAEFRGYIALLNLGDANFWWEIKHLPQQIQKSESITFAIEIFNAIDNNNYVRFFRLINEKATYLQACILLRYFNDVRARALARIVKAYAPRGGSRYPAEELMNSLAFESIESMRSFVNHYGLRFAKDESELAVILDRNQFIEDMDPYPVARAVNLIESKRQCTVAEVIAGGPLPLFNKAKCVPYSSFNKDGKLKDTALVAEDQGYNTINDSNKSVAALKAEIQKFAIIGGKVFGNIERVVDNKSAVFIKSESKTVPGSLFSSFATPHNDNKSFSFNPAIPVAPADVIKNSPDKVFSVENKNIFSFSKPQETPGLSKSLKPEDNKGLFEVKPSSNTLFGRKTTENTDTVSVTNSKLFQKSESTNIFQKSEVKSVFGQAIENKPHETSKNIFGTVSENIFSSKVDPSRPVKAETTNISKSLFAKQDQNSIDSKNIFAKAKEEAHDVKFGGSSNIFAKVAASSNAASVPTNIFGGFKTSAKNIFAKPDIIEGSVKPSSMTNGETATEKLSPGSLFKSANSAENKGYSIFYSKNKGPSVADNIFNSVNMPKAAVYDFENSEAQPRYDLEKERLDKEREEQLLKQQREEEKRRELVRKEQERREEERRKAEEQRKLEELRAEEKRKKEEQRRQEELRKKIEAERKAELKRQAEEAERKFKENVEKESSELIIQLSNEICDETLKEILREEIEVMKNLVAHAEKTTDEVLNELCNEIIKNELKAEKFLTEKLMKKWYHVWRKQFLRNYKRRTLLEDTPVWLINKSPAEQAASLRRAVERAAIKNMQAIHRGYKFSGELPKLPTPESYNLMEIIKSPFLRRMKQINYAYDKCFFWKVTIIKPHENTWMCRKIELHKWLLEVFSDKQSHEISKTLIRVEKQSWNNLMDFAISVSMANNYDSCECSQAIEGTNGLLFYFTENDTNIIETIEETIRHKYRYQRVPLAIVMPKCQNFEAAQQFLNDYCKEEVIVGYRIFLLDSQNIFESLNTCTKSALKWLAKNYPDIPEIEVDFLKSVCQTYVGREIWYNLKYERDNRMIDVRKDLQKLVACYNTAVEGLTFIITDEDLFNFPTFPLEFNQYLDQSSSYPKPYEFIPSNARNTGNVSAIKDFMSKLKLPNPNSEFNPVSVVSMQDHIRTYCKQIGWFQNPEQVVCKVVSTLPNELTNIEMSYEEFNFFYRQYDLIDILKAIVCEKIAQLRDFNNIYVIYKKSELENYRHMYWIHDSKVLMKMKHKALDYYDDLDVYIEAKRRKVTDDSIEFLMLEDKDCTMIDDNIRAANVSISKYSDCKVAVEQLELKVEEERKKSQELEKLLNAALTNY